MTYIESNNELELINIYVYTCIYTVSEMLERNVVTVLGKVKHWAYMYGYNIKASRSLLVENTLTIIFNSNT